MTSLIFPPPLFPPSAPPFAVATQRPVTPPEWRRFSESSIDIERRRADEARNNVLAAYHRARSALINGLGPRKAEEIIQSATSLGDLHVEALELERRCTEQGDSRTKRTAERLIHVLHYYSGVFDVLSQADCSFLCLIWGPMKFLIQMSKGHFDTLSKLTDMLADIGIALPRIEVYLKLLPTRRMTDFVTQLYTLIVDFLEEMARFMDRNRIRRFLNAFWNPCENKFHCLVKRIQWLEKVIKEDADAGNMMMMKYVVDTQNMMLSHLHSMGQQPLPTFGAPTPPITQQFRNPLLGTLPPHVPHHDDLVETYRLTDSAAWTAWFGMEQQHVPSQFTGRTGLQQALCDAPDPQHALQWVRQAQERSGHVVAAFLLWTKGTTAKSAVASLIFQMLKQRPEALGQLGLDSAALERAQRKFQDLWSLFLGIVRITGGVMLYISMGSSGEEEFAMVQQFVELVKDWNGPPIQATIIHPRGSGFKLTDGCIDLDELYDVEPWLTTTDALVQVMSLETKFREGCSDAIRHMLWDTLWRETRYAVIGVALNQTLEVICKAVANVRSHLPEDDALVEMWAEAVSKWSENELARNIMREQIQVHLDIVDLCLPEDVQMRLSWTLKSVVNTHQNSLPIIQSEDGLPRLLPSDERRKNIWEDMAAAIGPGTLEMFCQGIEALIQKSFDVSCMECPETAKDMMWLVRREHAKLFGRSSEWKGSFVEKKEIIIEGITKACETGFIGIKEAIASSL